MSNGGISCAKRCEPAPLTHRALHGADDPDRARRKSRGLTQQLLTETLLLSGIAGLCGLLVAGWTAAIATAAQPPQLSSQSYSILDWRVSISTVRP